MSMSVPVTLQAAAPGEDTKKMRRFSIEAYNGGAMRMPWSSAHVVVDLAGMEISEKPRPIFRDHDTNKIVGHTEAIKNNGKRLFLTGIASASNDIAREVVESSDNGFPWQASIGADIIRMEAVESGKVKVNGQTFQAPINIVRASRLGEVSFVALGADDSTTARMIASRSRKESPVDFTQWLTARGLDLATIDDAKKAELQAQFNQEMTKDDQPAVDQVKAMRENAAMEAERIASIYDAAKSHPDIQAKAIREGWSKDKTELEVLRASRPVAPAIITSQTGGVANAEVMTAGLLQATKNKTDGIKPEVLEAAHKRWHGRLSLQEMLLEAAASVGYTGARTFQSDPRGILEAAFSVAEISGILSTVANKALLAGYMGVDQAWRMITAIRPVRDFKTITSYRLTGGNNYEKVAPTGELKHGQLGEQSFTNKADTYGMLLGISRTDLINDDLGALSNVPQMIGRAAAIKLNEVFWTVFMANTSFFPINDSNRNYLAGVTVGTNDSRLNLEGLDRATQKFMAQVDPDSKPLGIRPKILLVPSALAMTAKQLMNSTEIRTEAALSSGGMKFPTSNPFAGTYVPVDTPYLGNSSFTGYSSTAWYLLADPADLPVIETVFLNGVEAPTVEAAEADFNVLGIQMRGYHDFGVTKQDYRAGVMSKGASA
jgi:hypothetical protein